MSYNKESWKRLFEAILTGNAGCLFLSHEDQLPRFDAQPCLLSSKRKKGTLVIIDEGKDSRFNAGNRLMACIQR
jgi:hypothetical protein